MTGRDLLCAIAGIDESIVLASGQFSAVESSIKTDRKRIRHRFTAIGIAAVICIAVFGVMKLAPKNFLPFTPSDTMDIQTPGVQDPSETGDTAVIINADTTTAEEIGSLPSGEQNTTVGRGTELPSSTTAPTSNTDCPQTQMPPTETPPTTNVHESTTIPSEEPSVTDPPEQHGDYAAMIKIADTVYIDTYARYEGEIDENSIKRSVSYTDEYPHNDGEQNFDRGNVDYIMINSDTVICRINGEWIVFSFFTYDNN